MEEPQATIWGLDNGQVRPIEFCYSKGQDNAITGRELNFMAKFKAAITDKNLGGLFGLSRYPGDNFPGSLEITQGRSNINLEPNDVCNNPNPYDHYTDSMQYPDNLRSFPTNWFFSRITVDKGMHLQVQ